MSGQLPYKDGVLLGQGIVGRDVEMEAARGLARQAVGDLDRVRIVQMLVFVASTPEFGEQSGGRRGEGKERSVHRLQRALDALVERVGTPAPIVLIDLVQRNIDRWSCRSSTSTTAFSPCPPRSRGRVSEPSSRWCPTTCARS
ncbi:hypothetical protein GCM10010255_11300 [Streptomyces coeruleofuscus]|uniref:RidA family protein n=1 Tax=Streptomyces coeruleofuscus TaxID=66879 RepID=A0ABN3HRB1_9ACTN